jgi:hypothetical protein
MEDAPLPDFFDSQAKPAETPAEPAKKRGRPAKATRKARTPRPKPVETATPEAAPEPKKRGPKPGTKRKTVPRSPKIELSVAFHALTGLSLDEAKIMASISAGLQQVPKKSRGRVVAALGKLFS